MNTDKIENEISYRKAKPADLHRITLIERRSFSYPWSKANFRKVINSKDKETIVAESKEIVGYIIFEIRHLSLPDRKYQHKVGHIFNIAVHPSRLREGIGTKLFEMAERRMAEEDVRELSLEVRFSNEEARKFYRSQDLTISFEVQSYYRNGDDAYVMTKPL